MNSSDTSPLSVEMPSAMQRLVPPHRARHTLYTLLFGTLVCLGLLVVRYFFTGHLRHSGLIFNLFLAWIPVLLALFIQRIPRGADRGRFWGAMVLWILFFPNTFYLVTDLIHFKKTAPDAMFRWFDLILFASFACGGIFLGCLSLYLMHLFMRQRFGWRAGWLFAAGMLALGSFGIYLGRFLRLNSWDVVARPFKLVGDLSALFEPKSLKEVAGFSATFFFFSLAAYSFVVSIARIHEGQPREEGAEEKKNG